MRCGGDWRRAQPCRQLRPQASVRSSRRGSPATAPSQLTYRRGLLPAAPASVVACGAAHTVSCWRVLQGKAKAVITTGALKTYHTTCTSTRYPSHVHHVRLFTTRLCVQTIVDTVQSGFSFTRACCCSTMCTRGASEYIWNKKKIYKRAAYIIERASPFKSVVPRIIAAAAAPIHTRCTAARCDGGGASPSR